MGATSLYSCIVCAGRMPRAALTQIDESEDSLPGLWCLRCVCEQGEFEPEHRRLTTGTVNEEPYDESAL